MFAVKVTISQFLKYDFASEFMPFDYLLWREYWEKHSEKKYPLMGGDFPSLNVGANRIMKKTKQIHDGQAE
jgi:hypothetical protein